VSQHSEKVWVDFINGGLAAIAQDEVDKQTARFVAIHKERAACKELKRQLKEAENRLVDHLNECIHLTTKGESAFEQICGDAR